MKKLIYVFTAILLSGTFTSCGEPSREEAHEEVVQQERTEEDALVGLEATQQEEREIDIVATDMDYQPNEIRVQAGQKLSIQLLNQGEEEHSIEFELPGGEKELPNPVPAGQSAILEFYAPEQAGTYTFYCPVDDHKDKGMVGQLIVE